MLAPLIPIGDQLEQVTNISMRFNGMAEREVGDYLITITTPHPFANQVTTFFQIEHDALHGALGNTNPKRDLSQYQIRV